MHSDASCFANTTIFTSKMNVNTRSCYQILNLGFLVETFGAEQELVAEWPGLPALHSRIGWKNRLQTWLAQSSSPSTAGWNCLQNTEGRGEREGQSVLVNTLVFCVDMRMKLQISKSIWDEKFWVLTSLCLKIWILSHVTDMMLFEIEKINALQTSFA